MVRIFCVASLALAAVSAVSGHIIRHRKNPPKGWETDILQPYHKYHDRYLSWGCENKHNTTFFQNCCHPLLKGESIDALDASDCDCEAGEPSVPSSSVPSGSPQPIYKTPAPETSSTPSSSPSPTSSSAKFRKIAAPAFPPVSPTSAPVTTTTKVVASSPSPVPSNNDGNGGNGSENTGGFATYFYQEGVAGACGKVHQDTDFICAMDSSQYGNSGNQSPLCGKQVKITYNQKSVTVVVADDCPTCVNANSIDLSVAAFEKLADLSVGTFPMEWEFV